MRRIAACIAVTLTTRPLCAAHAATRSISRASGSAAACASSQPVSTTVGLLPPRGFNTTSPVSRFRRNKRLTVARPMPNIVAVASYVAVSPLWYAATARRRKSKDVSISTFDHAARIASTRKRY
jgi:hypothetical protein